MAVKRVIEGAYHRNGIGGEPFHVVLFESDFEDARGEVMLGVVFDAPGAVAVLNMRFLDLGIVAFRENSHRGDRYEADLRAWVKSFDRRDLVQCDDCRQWYLGPAYYTLGTGYADGDGVVSGVFGDGESGLVHASDRSVCTGSLCPRCAGPDLEPDVSGDARRSVRANRAPQGPGPGHTAASVPARAYDVTAPGEGSWISCLKCIEQGGDDSATWRLVEEDGTFGLRECETCSAPVAAR